MSNEKSSEVVDETSHGITPSSDVHYPVVAAGTGKTLDVAAGAKAKEVHNVSILCVPFCFTYQRARVYSWPNLYLLTYSYDPG